VTVVHSDEVIEAAAEIVVALVDDVEL